MTDRLISADALKRALRLSDLMIDNWAQACDIVDEQPTAYDPEGVLINLNRKWDKITAIKSETERIASVADIVRKGGVDNG